LEQDFHQAFIDYAEYERAQDKIWKLRMKDENVDEYITTFEHLGHCAGAVP
jgi:Retrotransposon gag protein